MISLTSFVDEMEKIARSDGNTEAVPGRKKAPAAVPQEGTRFTQAKPAAGATAVVQHSGVSPSAATAMKPAPTGTAFKSPSGSTAVQHQASLQHHQWAEPLPGAKPGFHHPEAHLWDAHRQRVMGQPAAAAAHAPSSSAAQAAVSKAPGVFSRMGAGIARGAKANPLLAGAGLLTAGLGGGIGAVVKADGRQHFF